MEAIFGKLSDHYEVDMVTNCRTTWMLCSCSIYIILSAHGNKNTFKPFTIPIRSHSSNPISEKKYMQKLVIPTLNIKQEYLLQFLLLNIDSDVYWEIFVTSPCTTSVPKQRNIPGEKRRCGRYAELSFYADLTQFTLSSYIFWLARYMNFSR